MSFSTDDFGKFLTRVAPEKFLDSFRDDKIAQVFWNQAAFLCGLCFIY